jgi:Winged helix DNA-binding domain
MCRRAVRAACAGPVAGHALHPVRLRPRGHPGDPATSWLAAAEERIEESLDRRGSATGAELRAAEPTLRSTIPAGTRSETAQALTSPLLTLMSAEGRLVRGTPAARGPPRAHRWETVTAWWPDGRPHVDPSEAEASLARRWLERLGPATVEDLQWWTGWNKTTTRIALGRLQIEEADLHGRPGIDLPATRSRRRRTPRPPCCRASTPPFDLSERTRGSSLNRTTLRGRDPSTRHLPV